MSAKPERKALENVTQLVTYIMNIMPTIHCLTIYAHAFKELRVSKVNMYSQVLLFLPVDF